MDQVPITIETKRLDFFGDQSKISDQPELLTRDGLEGQEARAPLDGLTRRHGKVGDDPRALGPNLVLHLHGFEDKKESAGLHFVACADGDFDHASGHERPDLLLRGGPQMGFLSMADAIVKGVGQAEAEVTAGARYLDIAVRPRQDAPTDLASGGKKSGESAIGKADELHLVELLAAGNAPDAGSPLDGQCLRLRAGTQNEDSSHRNPPRADSRRAV